MALAFYVQSPPAIYDHAFPGKTYIVNMRLHEIDAACGGIPVLGCAPIGGIDGVCLIKAVTPGYDGIAKALYLRIIRHERGHCLGWPASHPTS